MIEDCLLSVQEIEVLLFYGRVNAKFQLNESLRLVKELERYVDKRYTSAYEKVKLLPKVCYVLALLLREKKCYVEMTEKCETALELLRKQGVLTCLPQLLELAIEGKRYLSEPELIKEGRQLIKIREIYLEYGYNEEEAFWWKNIIRGDIFLLPELIHNKRLVLGLTQEQLAELADCEQKTISKIESGKEVPGRKLFQKLREILQITQDYYFNSFITANDYCAFEKKEEIDQLVSLKDFEKASLLLQNLKENISDQYLLNKQYILWQETLLDMERGKISKEEAVLRFEKALRYTIKDFNRDITPKYILARQEILILNSLSNAIAFKDKEESIRLLKNILKWMENNKMRLRYQPVTAIFIMNNLVQYLEKCDFFEEAIRICEEAIKLAIFCQKGNFAEKFLLLKRIVLERIKENAEVKD